MRSSSLNLLPATVAFIAAAIFMIAGALGLTGCAPVPPAEIKDGTFDTGDGIEHIGSPDIDDTGATDDTAEPAPVCEFVVDTWDGEVIMGNNLIVSLNQDTPSGQILPGMNDVLVLDFTAQDPNCADILVVGFSVKILWTDNAGTGWHPSWLGMAIDDELVTGIGLTGGFADGTINHIGIHDAFVVPAGETVTTTFSAEMLGASAVEDDSVLFGLYTGSLTIYDGTNVPRTLHNEMLDGLSLIF
jgi:hypothetical protein